jgi:hypothetical protein
MKRPDLPGRPSGGSAQAMRLWKGEEGFRVGSLQLQLPPPLLLGSPHPHWPCRVPLHRSVVMSAKESSERKSSRPT